MITELENILRKKTMALVTLSFDGVGDVHDYVLWPIKWKNYIKNVQEHFINSVSENYLLKL